MQCVGDKIVFLGWNLPCSFPTPSKIQQEWMDRNCPFHPIKNQIYTVREVYLSHFGNDIWDVSYLLKEINNPICKDFPQLGAFEFGWWYMMFRPLIEKENEIIKELVHENS